MDHNSWQYKEIFNFFNEWEEPQLSDSAVQYHTQSFIDFYYVEGKLGKEYGYSPSNALRNLLLQYMTDECGWEDKRIGE